ncbi:MAG: deoxyribodipyrimidine photo-lyase [Anaerolineales bacterium]|nr:deoxyribodipyrimidine photo-lyase [Anaerolineales bacterium]
MPTIIWWARRDLRLADNQALASALERGRCVIPVFVLDPTLLNAPDAAEKRVAFLLSGLQQLDSELQLRGNRLIVRRGDPLEELGRLMRETGATSIFAEYDIAPFARERDNRIAANLPITFIDGLTFYPAGAVRKTDGKPYSVFTPYCRKWKSMPMPSCDSVVPAPERLAPVSDIPSVPIPDRPRQNQDTLFLSGEREAIRRLESFTGGQSPLIYRYDRVRDRMDKQGTSGLSPYLRFGMLSTRRVIQTAMQVIRNAPDKSARKGAETWLNELIWREFYQDILFHYPHVYQHSFRPQYRNIDWKNNDKEFSQWCSGNTGYPIVDAGMRQLLKTGWMHNRARMIVASFLVKDLLINWQWGERWFMQNLVDGDLAANNGGWQWVTGVGVDAAPYFRIFNPILQGQKFDPEGVYIRHWIPELQAVPGKFIHHPSKMSQNEQQKAGCIIGKHYPLPMVDHKIARERTLAAYAAARQNS